MKLFSLKRSDPRMFLLDSDRNYIHPALSSVVGYTRSGSVSVPSSDGSLTLVASDNVPRTWDNTFGWGYRVDPGWIQSFTYSHDFSNAAWTKTGLASSPAQTQTGPNGATDSWTLIEDTTASSSHGLSRTMSFTVNVPVTLTAIVASLPGSPSNRRFRVSLPASAFTTAQICTVDPSNGSTAIQTGSPTVTATQMGNTGYWFVAVTATPTTTVNGLVLIGLASGGTGIYTGDGASGLKIFASNITNTNYPVPVVTSTDTASTIGNPSWLTTLSQLSVSFGTQYSMGLEFVQIGALAGAVDALQMDTGSQSERSIIRLDAGGAALRTFLVAAGASGGTRGPYTIATNTLIKASATFYSNATSGTTYFNAQVPPGSSAITMPSTPDRIRIGSGVGVNYGALHIKRAWISTALMPPVMLQAYTK